MAETSEQMSETAASKRGGGWAAMVANRLLLALLAVSLIPMAFMGLSSQQSASSALRDQAFKQLETVNTITGQSVERYFQTLHDELRVLSEDRMVTSALRDFTAGVESLLTEDGFDEKAMIRGRRSLESFYSGEFAAAYRKATGTDPDSRGLVASLDDKAAKKSPAPAARLTVENVLELIVKQDGRCACCACPLLLQGFKPRHKQAFSIDRLDDSRGHARDNCRVCCLSCNQRHKA